MRPMDTPTRRLAALALALVLTACTSTGAPSAPAAGDATPAGSRFPGALVSWDPGFDRIVSPGTPIETLADGYDWTEGPAWIRGDGVDEGYLLFDDVPRNRMYRWSRDAGAALFLTPSGYDGPPTDTLREAGANGLFAEPGGTVLLADSGSRLLARLDPANKRKTLLVERFEGKRFNSPNDVVRRADGRIFFTDPPYGLEGLAESPVKELPFSGVFRLDPDGSVHLLDDTLRFPNGIALSPDGDTLYVANSDEAHPVWMAYALDAAGAVTARRLFADAGDLMAEDAPGLPDGMSVAADGHIFATGPGGVIVFDPDGRRLGRIGGAGGPISNVEFGDDGRSLYMTADDRLLRIRLQVAGPGFQDPDGARP